MQAVNTDQEHQLWKHKETESQSSRKSTMMEKSDEEAHVVNNSPFSFPEGGVKGWSVVFGAMIITGCTFGAVSAFGVYQTYYQSHQLSHKSPSDIAWIGSVQTGMMFGSGLVAGPLFDRYGARAITIPASLVYVFSIMMTSICKEYYQFILAQGLLSGIGIGFLFTPALSAVNHYFMSKRGIALGIVAIGSSIGGVIFPVVLENSFNSSTLGFAWGVRILGFAVLSFLVIACILIKERLPLRSDSFLLPGAFKQPSYSILAAGVFFILWGMFIPFFFLSEYAIVEIGMSDNLALYLLTILNALSLFGRLSSGALADKLGWLNLLTIVGICNTILLFCWPSTKTNAGIIVWTAVFGFFSGAIFTLFPASIAKVVPKPQFIGVYLGQAMGIFALSGLTGSPIAGALIAKYGFTSAAYFAGASMISGAVLVAVSRLCYSKDLTVLV